MTNHILLRAIHCLLIFVLLDCGSGAVVGAEQPKRPNILFAIADDWSFGHASAYGCKWTNTPNFDEIAKRGLLFTRTYTPNAKCAPSRACILTGRNSWQLKEACNHYCDFPPEFKSFPETLAENGYFVGMTGKGWGPGRARSAGGEVRNIAGMAYASIKAKPPAKGISNNDYSGNFRQFLKANESEKPWCFWYGTTEPHRGYQWRVGIDKGGKKLSDIDKVPEFWPDNDTVRTDMLDYAYEVEHFDMHLGKIIASIKAAGQFDNTIIVVTSDHGMPFPRCKGQAYDYSNHVPMAISFPKKIKRAGRVIDDYVSFIDLAPTFIEASGLNWSDTGMQTSRGKSLFDIFSSEKNGQVTPTRDHVLIGKERHDIGRPDDVGYPIRGIVKNNKIFLQNFEVERWPAGNPETGYLNCDGGPTKSLLLNLRRKNGSDPYWEQNFGKRPAIEFFDLSKDPFCVKNMSASPEWRGEIESMRNQMIRELLSENDRRMLGNGDYFEKIPYVGRAQEDFYNRFMAGEKLKAGWVDKGDFEKTKLD